MKKKWIIKLFYGKHNDGQQTDVQNCSETVQKRVLYADHFLAYLKTFSIMAKLQLYMVNQPSLPHIQKQVMWPKKKKISNFRKM